MDHLTDSICVMEVRLVTIDEKLTVETMMKIHTHVMNYKVVKI